MLLKLAWRNIWRNKRRTWITAGSIFFAVFFSVVMQSLQDGTYENMIKNMVQFYSGYVQVHKAGYWDDQNLDNSFYYSDSVSEKLNQIEGVKQLLPRLETFALGSYKQQSQAVMITGLLAEKEKKMIRIDEKLIEGEFLENDNNEALIGEELAEFLNLHVGDTLVIIGQGFQGRNAAALVPIKGIVDMKNQELNQRAVFVPLPFAQQIFSAENRVTSLAIDIEETANYNRIKSEITQLLDEEYEVMTWEEMMPEFIETMQSDKAGNYLIMIILYMIIGFGIFGTILMMTMERQYEFAVLISIGMHRYKLMLLLLLEMFFVSLLGVGIGCALALPIMYYYHFNPIELSGMAAQSLEEFGFESIIPFSVDSSILFLHSAIIFTLTIFMMLYPAWRVGKLHPVKAKRL